jgi:hypothetical protein
VFYAVPQLKDADATLNVHVTWNACFVSNGGYNAGF